MSWIKKLFASKSDDSDPFRDGVAAGENVIRSDELAPRVRTCGTSEIYLVGRREIQSCDVVGIIEVVNRCALAFKRHRILQLTTFGISGFDDDSRPLCAIPEVRKWCSQLYKDVPGIFGLVDAETISLLIPCICDIEIANMEQASSQIRWPNNYPDFLQEIDEWAVSIYIKMSSNYEDFDQRMKEFNDGNNADAEQLWDEFLDRLKMANQMLGL